MNWRDRLDAKRRACEDLLAKYQIKPPSCGFDVGLGWIPIVDRALKEMFSAGWDGELHQVKEKFCGLRIYIGQSNDEIDEAISRAEDAAATICEGCGRPHHLKVPRLGVALCPDCQKEWENR